jgi:ferredoxin
VRLRIEINLDECMSSGKCVADHPTVFDFDAEELAMVRPDAERFDDADLLRAARNCPSGAIQLFDEDNHRAQA